MVDGAAGVAGSQVTQSVIHNRLVMICREMGIAMMKTSYSTIFNEGLDFSCVIFNRDGEMIAQAEFCPAQLGAILYTVRWAIDEYGLENFEPGDVLIHNDPYRGGCHMPEHTIIKPVYYDDELFGFVANIGHVAEIGGMAPGSFAATATEVYQEGLRLPLVKIMRRGEYVQDIWKIILANHRTPRHTWGDFHAMIGSLHIAERRLHELLGQYGVVGHQRGLHGADGPRRAVDAGRDTADTERRVFLRGLRGGRRRDERPDVDSGDDGGP